MAYQRPMVTVDQNMTITPTSVEREQPAFVFGPNYELHRYSDANEKPGTFAGTYNGTALNLRYPNAVDDSKVDASYTKLVGDNAVVALAELESEGGGIAFPEKDMQPSDLDKNGGYTMLLFKGKAYVDRDTSGAKVVRDDLPHNLAAGDLLWISYGDTFGSGDSPASNTESVLVKIKSVAYSQTDVNLDSSSDDLEWEAGTLVTIEDAIPTSADLSSVTAKLAILEDGVEFDRKNMKAYYEGVAKPGYQWETPEDEMSDDDGDFFGVKVNKLYVQVAGYFTKDTAAEDTYCEVVYSDLYITFRELVTSYSDTFHSLTGASSVSSMLGVVSPDNPLAMGVYMAALNAATDDGSESPPVYFMAVSSDDETGYDKVLDKASLNDRAYVFAPTTRDDAILEKVRAHVLAMSTNTVKKWRIAAASSEIPRYEDKLNSKMDPQGDDFLAIPILNASKNVYDKFRVVKSAQDLTGNPDVAFRATLVEGDVVRFYFRNDPWGEPTCDEYVIKSIINNYTVEINLKDGKGITLPPGGAQTPSKIEVYHELTSAQSAEKVASLSSAWATRRMINVFPSVFGWNGETLTGEFAACAVAGLISATEPQQPITNVTVRGIDDIPMVYQQYNNDELNVMAAGGTFIVAQDLPDDIVYVRHQITTAYPDGNLNTAELSITKNVDSISYAFAEVFRPYYGKYNILPGLLAILENLAGQLISQLGGGTSVYGPQLITEDTTINYVRQNALLKDHVDVSVSLAVPYPCNNIDIVLTV